MLKPKLKGINFTFNPATQSVCFRYSQIGGKYFRKRAYIEQTKTTKNWCSELECFKIYVNLSLTVATTSRKSQYNKFWQGISNQQKTFFYVNFHSSVECSRIWFRFSFINSATLSTASEMSFILYQTANVKAVMN